MSVTRITIPILTSAGGAFTTTTGPVAGPILQWRYVPDGSVPLDTNSDIDITATDSGLVVADQDNIGTTAFTKTPRQPTHAADGSASLFAAGGEPVEDKIYIGGETLTVTIAQGGNAKAGTVYIWYGS